MSDYTVLYDPLGPRARRRANLGSMLALACGGLLAYLVLDRFAAAGQLDAAEWAQFADPIVLGFLAEGLLANIVAACLAGAGALALGTALAIARLSRRPWMRLPATAYVEFIRGIPPLLILFFLFFGLPAYGVRVEVFWVLVLGITVYNAALFAEIIRAGILSLPRGQLEAALAVGMRPRQAMAKVVLPQAVAAMVPALISQMVVLIKDTTLGQLITYEELLRRGRLNAQLEQGTDLQNLLVVAVVFIVMNLALSYAANRLERRRRRHRPTVQATTEPLSIHGGS